MSSLEKPVKKRKKFKGWKRFCLFGLAFIHRETKKYSRGLGWIAVVLLSLTAFFLLLYCADKAENAFILALSNAIPFILSSTEQATGAFNAILGCEPSVVGVVLTSAQKLLSFVFLFLIGLGLRNRFRL